jgi:hypothetical protein
MLLSALYCPLSHTLSKVSDLGGRGEGLGGGRESVCSDVEFETCPTLHVRPALVSNHTSVKRDLTLHVRPALVSKETYTSFKRDLPHSTCETCTSVKRDLPHSTCETCPNSTMILHVRPVPGRSLTAVECPAKHSDSRTLCGHTFSKVIAPVFTI